MLLWALGYMHVCMYMYIILYMEIDVTCCVVVCIYIGILYRDYEDVQKMGEGAEHDMSKKIKQVCMC